MPPCYDSRNDIVDLHNSESAELLCQLIKRLEGLGQLYVLTPAQLKWWKEHKKRDSGR